MPRPIAICIEDLDAAPDASRYLQCVALAGADPGLTLDARGTVHWCATGPACSGELWVSLDQRLMLMRPAGAPPGLVLHRGGRSLEIPEGKPVVLVDQDLLQLAGRRLRIHVHGEAPAVHPPRPLEPLPPSQPAERSLGYAARAAAAALALGAAVGITGCKTSVEVRDQPPKVAPTEPAGPGPDMKVPAQPDTRPNPDTRPIEVRIVPPKVSPVEPPEE